MREKYRAGLVVAGIPSAIDYAAELLRIDQPKVSGLVRGRLPGFSLPRAVLVLLGSDLEIVVKPRRRAPARARVLVPEILSETCIQISDSLHHASPGRLRSD